MAILATLLQIELYPSVYCKKKKNSNCESFKSVFIAIVKVKLYSNDFFLIAT